jgi:hypothetical protein
MKPNYKNPMNRPLTWLSASLITLASAQAATIAFDAPFLIIDDTALDVPLAYPGATIAQAVNFGSGAGSGAQSVVTGAQTVNFTAGTISGSAASGTATTLFQVGGQGGVLLSPTTTGDTQFDNVLKSDGWANTANNATPITLQIGGLTIGQTYVVSLFSADGRAGSAGRAQQYFDTFSAGVFSGGSSAAFSQNPSTMVTGTFTADAEFQRIYIQETDGIGSDDTTLSAFTLYAVPEPSSALLLTGAGLLIGFRRNRR